MREGVAIHEAAHALAGYVLGVRVTGVSLLPKEMHLGITHFNASGEESGVACATIFAAGSMAEAIAAGRPQRFNWLDVDDHDVARALWFLDREECPDPLAVRRLVELKSRSLLSVRWAALTRLADELERRRVLVGAQVNELLQGVRRVGDPTLRPVDPTTRHASVGGATIRDKEGRPVSMQRWAKVLDGTAGNTRRALALVNGEKGETR